MFRRSRARSATMFCAVSSQAKAGYDPWPNQCKLILRYKNLNCIRLGKSTPKFNGSIIMTSPRYVTPGDL
jgi:hypothetical protein